MVIGRAWGFKVNAGRLAQVLARGRDIRVVIIAVQVEESMYLFRLTTDCEIHSTEIAH